MNSTLVDNATLDFLIESTKAHISQRIAAITQLTDPTDKKVDLITLSRDVAKICDLPQISSHYIREINEQIDFLKPISTTEL